MSENNKKEFHKLIIDRLEIFVKPDGVSSVLIWGWSADTEKEDQSSDEYILKVNGKELPYKEVRLGRPDVVTMYPDVEFYGLPGFALRCDVPAGEPLHNLSISLNGRKPKEFSEAELEKHTNRTGLDYAFDAVRQVPEGLEIVGWLASATPEFLELSLRDASEKPLDNVKTVIITRYDVERSYLADNEKIIGFSLMVPSEVKAELPLTLHVSNQESQWDLKVNGRTDGFHKLKRNLNPSRLRYGFQYLRNYGTKSFIKAALRAIGIYGEEDQNVVYNSWFANHRIMNKELKAQRQTVLKKQPKFSLIVAAYNPPHDMFAKMVESVLDQSYGNWELCIADGSSNDTVREYLKTVKDNRIKSVILKENLGISGNMNAAAELATGDYIVLYDHDDFLEPDALFELAKAVNEKEYGFIYTDEDKYDSSTGRYSEPNFKPDFSPALLKSVNYICHMLAVRADLFKQLGGLRKEFDGAQDYDLVLRLMDLVEPANIRHIPKVLYHWRIHSGSTSSNADSKTWAFDAGKAALEDWGKRNQIGLRVENGPHPGQYHVIYDTPGDPLISIIIPNKDLIDDLTTCVSSLYEKSTYRNFEVIIVENNSTDPKTFEAYETMEAKYPNLKVIRWPSEFNYSAINNYALPYANGDYLLFLNNDTELLSEDLLSEMLGQAMQENVGAVGAKLYFKDDSIQHNGVIIGLGGIAGHAFLGREDEKEGNYRMYVPYNVSAVTAACMMVPKKVFEEVGGFNEKLKVAFNDVDLCLKIREAGYWLVQDPYATMHHYESKSRGYEDTVEKQERFLGEIRNMYRFWPDPLRSSDPFYNPNLTLLGQTYHIAADHEKVPFITPDFLGEEYYTAGTIRPERKK